MKRMFIKMLPVMAAVLLATSCSKDDGNDAVIDTPIDNGTPQVEAVDNGIKTITITGKLSKESLSKVTVAESEGVKTLQFEGNETFAFGTEGEGNVYGTIAITNGEGLYTATLNFPDEATLTATSGFQANYGTDPSAISEGYANLATAVKNAYYTIDFIVKKSGDTYSLKDKTNTESEIKVYVKSAFINATATRTITVNGNETPVTKDKIYVVSSTATMGSKQTEIIPGKIYTVKALDYLPYAFTVDASGTQVYFSKGNLQYNVTANEWRFAEHQYDYVGGSESGMAGNVSGSVNTNLSGPWIDLFGWVGATSNWNDAPRKYGVTTSTTTNSADGYGIGSSESLKSDWGKVFGDESQWRTLTGGNNGEWKYLLDTRTTTSSVRYAKAQVAGVKGLIIVPDDWSQGTYNLQSTNTTNADYTSNVIDATTWSNTLESTGAVFLPAAGYRDGSSVILAGSNGYYWSSSANDSGSAYNVFFSSGNLRPANYYNGRYVGFSVRLVRSL